MRSRADEPCVRCGALKVKRRNGACYCPYCKKLSNKRYRILNLESVRAKIKENYLANKQKRNKYARDKYKENRTAILERAKKYRVDNHEKIKQNKKDYYRNNKDLIREKRLSNKEEISKKRRDYYYRNREKSLEQNKRWMKENEVYRKAYCERYRKDIRHPLRITWRGMLKRCNDPKHKDYKNYGGRGIRVCERWYVFTNFVEDMYPTWNKECTLDRYPDNNGNYEPSNCRWATAKQQANNTRAKLEYRLGVPEDSPVYLEYGKLGTLKEFSEKYKLPLIIAKYRYAKNYDSELILKAEIDRRYYEWKGHHYNLMELHLLSSIKLSTLRSRIQDYGWTVGQAIGMEERSS